MEYEIYLTCFGSKRKADNHSEQGSFNISALQCHGNSQALLQPIGKADLALKEIKQRKSFRKAE